MANGIRQTDTAVVITTTGVAATVVSDVTTIDSFEDEDMSEYSIGADGFVTSPVIDGNVAVMFNSFANGGSTSGLNAYPQKGDIWKVYFRETTGATYCQVYFGFTDTNNYYGIEFGSSFTRWRLNSSVSGTESTIADDNSVTYSTDTWYEGIITWDDGTLGGSEDDITCELRDFDADTQVTSISANNSDHAGVAGFGLNPKSFDTGEENYIDHAHITNR